MALPASAQTAIKIAHPNVPDHPMGQAFSYFEELVESRSNGEFEVDVYHSSQFGNFDSVVQGLQTGMLQMGSASTPNLAPFSNDFLIFDMPFLFPSYEAADMITDGPIGRTAAQALSETGIIGLGYIDIGFRHIFNNKRSVETISDLEGLKIRSTPSSAHIATLELLGINPTPISWNEVYTALQQGTVDGIDIDLNLAWFNNFHEVNKNLTLVRSLYSPHLVMISQNFYDSLDPNDQIMISEAFAEMKLYQRKLIRENEEMIIGEMEKAGVNIVELSEEERAEWAAATQGVYDQFEDEVGSDLIERARATMTE
ncbi:TRAP transporter substrate-binding protein [Vreelandella andesensis]|uniref:TRAP transporter substrate-binding protein n=2 Tax=Vreelandella andesensis TaxID=447567 RepID=A0A3S0YVF1_9GAMM|nr:TRAP transporter substrate-binding protein [Halomonas andesensis]